jgi:hypothetical protein
VTRLSDIPVRGFLTCCFKTKDDICAYEVERNYIRSSTIFDSEHTNFTLRCIPDASTNSLLLTPTISVIFAAEASYGIVPISYPHIRLARVYVIRSVFIWAIVRTLAIAVSLFM